MGCSYSEYYYEEYSEKISQFLVLECGTCGRKLDYKLKSERIYKKNDTVNFGRCGPNCERCMLIQRVYVQKNAQRVTIYGEERYTMANNN